MNRIDVTETRAVSIDAANQALAALSLDRPLRWLREVHAHDARADQQFAEVYTVFWIEGNPKAKYILRVRLSRIDPQDESENPYWQAEWVQGHIPNDQTLCVFRFKLGRLNNWGGRFPYSTDVHESPEVCEGFEVRPFLIRDWRHAAGGRRYDIPPALLPETVEICDLGQVPVCEHHTLVHLPVKEVERSGWVDEDPETGAVLNRRTIIEYETPSGKRFKFHQQGGLSWMTMS